MSVSTLNPRADVISKHFALMMNIGAAKGLQGVVKSNLGPNGTIKMLVGGAGDIKLTKDGNVLLHQMQIQHPTASLIARTATAQDDISGDGTTSNVLFTGELLAQAERYVADGVHPRVLVEGYEIAKDACLNFLESFKESVDAESEKGSRAVLMDVARTSLRTKLHEKLADHMTSIVVDAVLCIRRPGVPIDLHMIEIMTMTQRSDVDTTLVQGLVLDHGARHPQMKRYNENCLILTCNVSLEYEKSEVNSSFFYKNAEERERMVKAERKFTDDRVWKIVELKRQVCSGPGNENKSFIVINQKGIDPLSLEILQQHGIVGIRRAKKRNMERLSLACGGYCVNSVDDLDPACLGYADKVYEQSMGDDKFTFIEGVRNPQSCTVLVRAPNKHTIDQIKDALRDGLRAVLNVLEDGHVVPGAGAFEVAAYHHLMALAPTVEGRPKLGVRAFADALLIVPKTLAANSGLDTQDAILALVDASQKGQKVGLDLSTGRPMIPRDAGVIDNFRVKRQLLQLGTVIATKLLLVDEVMRAGRATSKDQE